ncbi:MAG: putative glycoside hydrolase [bacterium]|nr:putative glycoside hydrolase [bacterium]
MSSGKPHLKDRILLGLAHYLDRRMDRRAQRSLPDAPGSRKGPRVWVVLLLIIALIVPALSMVPVFRRHQDANQASRSVEDQTAQKFRAKLPENARYAIDPDGEERLLYQCVAPNSARAIARKIYNFSAVFQSDDLADAIEKANPTKFNKKQRCITGEELAIPEALFAPIQNTALGWPVDRPVHAMYLRGDNTRPGRLEREVERMREIGANGVVFDVKDIIGVVNYRSSVPEVEAMRRHSPPIRNLAKTIKYLHDQGIYVIARTALFQDENLAINRPDLAIKDRGAPNGILLVKGKPLWVDAGRPEVRKYNLKIVQELVTLGVDEIQFDYIRYPAEGNLSQVEYYKLPDANHKTDYLVNFLAGAFLLTRPTDVRVSIDIFGIVAWGEEVDIRATGQRLNRMATFVDVISPMLYPSHFNSGFDGFENPADEGYHFYYEGVKRVLELSEKPGLVVRPWLQAFRWRVKNYNERYIRQQINGNHSGGGIGWMMWNAGNDYDLVYRALRNRELTNGNGEKQNRNEI